MPPPPLPPLLHLTPITHILTKSLPSNTPINILRPTINPLQNLKNPQHLPKLPPKSVQQLYN
ncbi:uS5 family small ribosomal subunit protein [Staphylococcus epidermidis]|uniref:hypothetical protein n=1 Tax=Staphylococcus epidermidis TaxID=1282 RepID=UPI0021B3AC82|nr:hypothetical protein [Staphylococcus epidermidis]